MKIKLLSLYLLFLSFTSAFAVSPWLTIPTLFSIAFTGYLLLFVKKQYISLRDVDVILLVFAGFCVLSFSVNFLVFRNSKQINHFFAYEFSIIIQFILFRIFLFNACNNKYDWIKLIKFIFYGMVFTSLFGIFEFTVKLFSIIDIDSYIPRPLVSSEYEPTFWGIVRVRSFVEESGHLSLYLEIFFPLVFWYARQYLKFKWFIFSISVILICFIISFSSIGFFVLILNLGIILGIFCFNLLKSLADNGKIKIKYFIFLSLVLILFFLNFKVGFDFYELYNDLILLKLESSSGSRRSDAIAMAIDLLKSNGLHNFFIGFGPGAYDAMGIDSIISLYINILFELGLFGVLTFLFFIYYVFINVLRIHDKTLRLAFFLSFCNGFVHYSVISNYWYPWIWVLTAMLFLYLKLQKNKFHENLICD